MVDQSDYLVHHGILGQKWGVRRYQNPDGSYTSLGKKEHAADMKDESKYDKKIKKYSNKSQLARAKGKIKAANKFAIKATQYREKKDKISWDKLSYDEQKVRKDLLNKGLDTERKAENHMFTASKFMNDKTKLSEFEKEYEKYEKMMKKAETYYDEYRNKYGELKWNYSDFELKKR